MKANSGIDLRISSLLRDERNLELIRLLQADPRASISELARRIGMSAPAVKERLTRLEEEGVIAGYRLDLDPKALGWPIMVFVRVRPMPGQLPRIAELARSLPQVAECHRITGEDCFYIKLHLRSIEELPELLDQFLLYGQTTTSIINESPIPDRPPPPAREQASATTRPDQGRKRAVQAT